MKEISDEAKEARNAYQRAWRLKNPEKMKQYGINYWERKAANYTIVMKVKDLSSQGLSQREISRRLEISLGTVNRYLNTPLNTY